MPNFEETITGLVHLARLNEDFAGERVDRIVDAYLLNFVGNRALERDRVANAFEESFGRRFPRADEIYRRVKRL